MTAPLSDGALLWVFCATSVLPSTQVVRDSTAAIAPAESPAAPSDVLDGSGVPYEFITPPSTWDQVCDAGIADGRRVVPLSVDTVTSGTADRVVVFYEHVCLDGGVAVSSGGIGVAEFLYDSTAPPTGPIEATVVSDLLWAGAAPTAPGGGSNDVVMGGFGRLSAYAPGGDEIYVYRCDTDAQPVAGCQVGRVASSQVGSPASYEWWDADQGEWSTSVPGPAVGLMSLDSRDGESALGAGSAYDVSWHPTMGVWTLTYLEWGLVAGHGSTAVVYVADEPNGPWSAPVRVAIDECAPTAPTCRGVYDHPGLGDSDTQVTLGFFSDPAVGGDGGVHVVNAGMFTDSWVDVPRSDPDFDDLDLLGSSGLVDRIHPTYTFRPDVTATRAETAELLWRVVGLPLTSTPPVFTDVDEQHPNATAVAWLVDSAIDDTPPGGQWSPDTAIRRETLALWLWNDAGAPQAGPGAPFTDVPAGHPYFDPIMWAYQQGLIEESTPTTFDPEGGIMRRDVGVAAVKFHSSLIVGIVTDDSNDESIGDVAVTVYDSAHSPVGAATTGPDGRYHVSWLADGADYTVGFTALGFANEWYDDKPQATTAPADGDPVKVDSGSPKPTFVHADLTRSAVSVTKPSSSMTVFASETLAADVADFDDLDRVDFSVDGVVVGTDSDGSDGWSVTWDTAATADGAHSVQANAVDTNGGEAASEPHEVTVANALAPWDRVQTDYEQESIDVDTYLPLLLQANLEPSDLLPARYLGPTGDEAKGGTTELLAALASSWDALSPTVQVDVEQLLTQSVQVGAADPDFIAEFDLLPDPGDENVYPGCDNNAREWGNVLAVRGIWCVQTIPYSTAVCQGASFTCTGNGTEVPDLKFRYSVNGSDAAFVDDPTSEVPGTVVPQQMLDMANQFFNGFESYETMGFEIGGNLDQKPLNVVMNTMRGRAFTSPICWSCHGSTSFGDFGIVIGPPDPVEPDNILATARHEAFHIMQYNYVSEYDVLGEYIPLSLPFGSYDRHSTLWWMEATAEWADHQAVAAMRDAGQSPPGPTNYASAFDDLVGDPAGMLTRFGISTDPQYGAFILAEYLQDRFDTPGQPSFVLRTFEELDEQDSLLGLDERTGIDVIEDVLDENGTTLKNAIPRFWASAYLLDEVNMLGVGFTDPDVGAWRGTLGDGATGDDDFSALARPARVGAGATEQSPVVVPHQGGVGPLDFRVASGGAGIIDFSMEAGWKGTVQADIGVDPSANLDDYVAVVVAYDASGYPKVCDRDGYTVVEFQDLSQAMGTHVELDEECPTASLLIVNHDAKSRNAPGDTVSVTLSMFQPQPMAPPTEHTATIDGPGVTDIGPGEVVGIVSDPPASGPGGGSGALCVAVTVHSGAGSSPFFPQVSPRIQLVEPFTDTVLRQLSGLDTLMSPNSTRTFNLGPYTHDPWTALAVTVQPDLGDVLGWNAFPTSC